MSEIEVTPITVPEGCEVVSLRRGAELLGMSPQTIYQLVYANRHTDEGLRYLASRGIVEVGGRLRCVVRKAGE